MIDPTFDFKIRRDHRKYSLMIQQTIEPILGCILKIDGKENSRIQGLTCGTVN